MNLWNLSCRINCINFQPNRIAFLFSATTHFVLRFIWSMELESRVSQTPIDLRRPATDKLSDSTSWIFCFWFRLCHCLHVLLIIYYLWWFLIHWLTQLGRDVLGVIASKCRCKLLCFDTLNKTIRQQAWAVGHSDLTHDTVKSFQLL